MLSRFFHVRSGLKLFVVSPQPAVPAADRTAPGATVTVPHADYDRHPLDTRGFDHYVEWNEDDERFVVH